MLDEVVKEFPEDADTEEEDDIPKIAVVGKPNVGKSSLINHLLGEDRVIVSDIAGTTRDAVDARVKWQVGITFLLIQPVFAGRVR